MAEPVSTLTKPREKIEEITIDDSNFFKNNFGFQQNYFLKCSKLAYCLTRLKMFL